MFVYVRAHVGMRPLSETHAWHHPMSIITVFTDISPVSLRSICLVTRLVTLSSVFLLPLHFW
jgi:hypothetical protein